MARIHHFAIAASVLLAGCGVGNETGLAAAPQAPTATARPLTEPGAELTTAELKHLRKRGYLITLVGETRRAHVSRARAIARTGYSPGSDPAAPDASLAFLTTPSLGRVLGWGTASHREVIEPRFDHSLVWVVVRHSVRFVSAGPDGGPDAIVDGFAIVDAKSGRFTVAGSLDPRR